MAGTAAPFDKAARPGRKTKSEFPENALVRWDLAELNKIERHQCWTERSWNVEEILKLKKIRKSYYLVKLVIIYQLKEDWRSAIEFVKRP